MKPIYLFCAHWIRTGGPEAVHQLSDALIEQGFDARLIYYEQMDFAILHDEKQVGWGLLREFPERACPFKDYAHYRTKLERRIDLDKPSVVVVPETMCHLVGLFPAHFTVLVWWLSADNAFGSLSGYGRGFNLNHLRKPNVWHVTQSTYAKHLVDALQLRRIGRLSDYTVDLRQYAEPLPWRERPPLVVYNANHKVIHDVPALMERVAEMTPGLQIAPVMGSREEVAEMFARARVYLDLGCFPGADRMPREAMDMGCAAIVADTGAAHEENLGIRVDPHNPVDIIMRTHATLLIEDIKLPEREHLERIRFFQEVHDVFTILAQETLNGKETQASAAC